MPSKYQKSIGSKAAIAMADAQWWTGKESREIALVGLITAELCLPFTLLHEHVEKALGRPVFTHEFTGDGCDRMIEEIRGERDAPTINEIIALIPEAKRILVTL